MLTIEDRKKLGGSSPNDKLVSLIKIFLLGDNPDRWDCYGNTIKPGDDCEVMREEEFRQGNPDYTFCSVGKKGKILRHLPGCNSWFVSVEFVGQDGKPVTVGCVDINLRKINNQPKPSVGECVCVNAGSNHGICNGTCY